MQQPAPVPAADMAAGLAPHRSLSGSPQPSLPPWLSIRLLPPYGFLPGSCSLPPSAPCLAAPHCPPRLPMWQPLIAPHGSLPGSPYGCRSGSPPSPVDLAAPHRPHGSRSGSSPLPPVAPYLAVLHCSPRLPARQPPWLPVCFSLPPKSPHLAAATCHYPPWLPIWQPPCPRGSLSGSSPFLPVAPYPAAPYCPPQLPIWQPPPPVPLKNSFARVLRASARSRSAGLGGRPGPAPPPLSARSPSAIAGP